MQVISLFSGIGGFEIAAREMGWKNVVSCEINPFGRKVLEYHFPESYHHDDVHTLNYEKIKEKSNWNPDEPTIIVGGFPCQPYSVAGKRKGKDDARHLFPEMLRIIREVKPRWVVGENVFGIINWNGGLVFHEVQTDLEAEGYEVQAYVLPAVSVNAPHRRDRVWFVAHARSSEHSGNAREVSRETKEKNGAGIEQSTTPEQQVQLPTIPSSVFGDATNTNSFRLEQCENSTEMGRGQEKMGRQGSKSTNAIKTDGTITATSKSNNIGGQQIKRHGIGKSDEHNEITTARVIMHPDSTIREGEHIRQEGKGEFNRSDSGNEFNRFKDFPTQSPICGGNDGIPEKLDSITIPKWRNESIMAYGNAVVPQLVLQIFKTIQQYEDNFHS